MSLKTTVSYVFWVRYAHLSTRPLDYVNRGALRACLYKAARYARTSVLSQVSVALRARAPTHTVRSHSLTHKQATSRATYLIPTYSTVLSTIHLLPEATLRNSIYYTTRAALGAQAPTLADLPCRQHALPPDTYASSVGQGARTGCGSFYEQSCRCLGDQLDAARALASQIADRSDICYGMACVTTFGDFAEHAPHEL